MSVLGDIFKELGIPQEKIIEIVNQLKTNPLGAMGLIQELKLSQETNQKIMETVMMQPASIDELAGELGISGDVLDSIKEKMTQCGGMTQA